MDRHWTYHNHNHNLSWLHSLTRATKNHWKNWWMHQVDQVTDWSQTTHDTWVSGPIVEEFPPETRKALDDKVESVHRHELVDELHLSELVHLSGSEQPQSINRTTKPPLLSSTAVLTLPFRPQRPIFDIESFEKNNSSEANTDVSQSCTSSQLLLQTSRGSYICISFLL